AAVVGHVDLAAEQWLDAGLAGLAVELDRPGHGAVVGEPDRRHLELSGLGREGGDAARPVEDRVLGVDVKVDERRFGHGKPILVGRSASAGSTQESGPAGAFTSVSSRDSSSGLSTNVSSSDPAGSLPRLRAAAALARSTR